MVEMKIKKSLAQHGAHIPKTLHLVEMQRLIYMGVRSIQGQLVVVKMELMKVEMLVV